MPLETTPEFSQEADQSLQWQAMIDGSPLCTLFFAPDGSFVRGNRAWREQWSATDLDWGGYNILRDPHFAGDVAPLFAKGFAGEAVELSPMLYDPARAGLPGAPRWIAPMLNPLRGADGTVLRVLVFLHDVSEFKQSEDMLRFLNGISAALSFSLNRETILERVADLAVPYLADWCFADLLETDTSFQRMAVTHGGGGRDAQVAELKGFYELRRDETNGTSQVLRSGQADMLGEIDADWASVLATQNVYLSALRQLGVKHYLCVPLKVHGRILGTMTFGMSESGRAYDESQRALAEELARRAALAVDNAQLYREAQEANRTKDEFLMVAAHELRTPLTTLVGYAHMLLGDTMTVESRQQALERVEQEAWSLVQIVNDIVDVSRVIAGKIQLDPRPLEVTSVIELALNAIRPAAESKRIELINLYDRNAGIVSGDAARLQQILWHLLSNAVKFTPIGGRVELKVDCSATHLRISVTDTGVGISKEFLPFVFERFRQQDSSLTRQHEGLGLGLAIVSYLGELHGGKVRASSPGEGQGATFTVELPLVAALSFESLNQLPYQTLDEDDPTLLASLRILAVERDAETRELIETSLTRFGAEVRASASATEALLLMSDWTPDVLISDMSMPGIDGYALIRRVRKREAEEGGQIPAVALTAHMRTTDRLRSLSAGYQAHLAKPLRTNELAIAIANLTGRGDKLKQ